MSKNKAPSPIREADYEAIEAALLQSARGRWFLAEFSTRNRTADTRMLLDAISRLESTMLNTPSESAPTADASMRHDLIEMSEAIAQTRREIASMRPADQDESRFSSATEELDAIVESTEKATSSILEAAEDVQETAWLLREQDVDGDSCDRLDARATDIYTACSFQDLTGQRISKVVQVLSYLEKRVCSMIDIWGLDDVEVRLCENDDDRPDAHLLNGPALQGQGIDQGEVDEMLLAHGKGANKPQDQAETDMLMNDPVMADDPVMAPRVQTQPAAQNAPVASPEPVEMAAPAAQPIQGEVQAADFSAPPSLGIDDLDNTKKQALFS